MQCLGAALRPLRVEELAELLALDFSTGAVPKLNTDWRWEDQEEAVLSACSSLVTVIVHKSTRIVQFSHFSVREFLTSHHLASSADEVSRFHILFIPSHVFLAHACLSALLRLDDHSDINSVEKVPLYRYAAKHWVSHAKFGNVEPHVMDDFLDMDKPHFLAWVKMHGHLETFSVVRSGVPIKLLPSAAPLYLAADMGYCRLMEHLVAKHPQLVDAWGGEHGTPLHATCVGSGHLATGYSEIEPEIIQSLLVEHLKIAQLLLTHGADINARSADECTPLHLASEMGNLDFVRWLLNHGAEVNPQNAYGLTPLHLAAIHGLTDVSSNQASNNGNTDIVHLLLDHGADADVRDNNGNTPLHSATFGGHIEVVRILLALNVEVNARDDKGSTPLLEASANGNIDVFRLLLDNNASPDVCDDNGNTPLHIAASCNSLEVARILLDLNVDIDAQNDEGSTALHRASKASVQTKEHPEIVQLLLNHGAAHHVRDNGGNTALHIAAFHGCLTVSEILLRHNAEIDVRNDNGCTPLLRASKAGYLYVVKLLLDKDAEVHVRDNSGNTALHLAAAGGGFGLWFNHLVELFRVETKEGASSRINEGSSQSPQISLDREDSGEGSPEIVRLLLDHGLDAQVCNTGGKTASDVARGPRRQQIIQLLSGDVVELTNQTGWSGWDSDMYHFMPSFEEMQALVDENEKRNWEPSWETWE